MSSESVVVAMFHHRHQAEMARGYLEDAGIPATMEVDDGGGAFGMPLTFSEHSFAHLRVMERHAERALRLLREGGFVDEEGEGNVPRDEDRPAG